jgi:hypothetical protein
MDVSWQTSNDKEIEWRGPLRKIHVIVFLQLLICDYVQLGPGNTGSILLLIGFHKAH